MRSARSLSLDSSESDDLKKRLDSHMRSKDFWSRVVVFAAKDSSLNKAHVKQLEFRLIELAKSAGRAEVENSNVGTSAALAEADQAMLDGFWHAYGNACWVKALHRSNN